MIRVAQWATGSVGTETLRAVIDLPSLELVAVLVHSSDKDGVDAGSLAGRPPTGVLATRSLDSLLAAGPDVVVYTPRTASVAEVCELLAAGVDVVTSAFCFHPARMAPGDRSLLAAAALAGSSSLHGTGLNPGNFGLVLPLALSGLCGELRRITIQERADWSVYESTGITFDNMRFGQPVAEVTEEANPFLAFNGGLFREQVWLLGDALGADLDEVVTTLDVVPALSDHDVFDRRLEAGTAAGQRWRWAGRRAGETLVEIETLWTVGGEYPPGWPTPEHGWTVTIEGDPSLQARVITLASFERVASMAEHVHAASVATARQVVNAVPHVHAAAPGFVTVADLPLVTSAQGFRTGPSPDEG